MNDVTNEPGIIREQGEFFDVKPLSEKDAKLFKEQTEAEKKKSKDKNDK